jgi:hypothetical protein
MCLISYDVPMETNGRRSRKISVDVKFSEEDGEWISRGDAYILNEDGQLAYSQQQEARCKEYYGLSWKVSTRSKHYSDTIKSHDQAPVMSTW